MSYLSLYEIIKEFGDIIEEVELNEGDLSPELEERLTINREDLKEKISKYRSVIDTFEQEEGRLKLMAQGLTHKANNYKRGVERLKGFVNLALKTLGQKKETNSGYSYFVELEDGKATAINYPKLEIENMDNVPEEYKTYSITIKTTKEGLDIIKNNLETMKEFVGENITIPEPSIKTNELKGVLKDLPLRGNEYAKLADDYKVKFT